MAIVTRKRNDGTPSYYVKYRDATKQEHWEQFDRKKDAQARDAEVKALKARNRTWSPPTAVRFDVYAQQWLDNYATHAVKPRVLGGYQRAVRVVLNPALGTKQFAGSHGRTSRR